LTQQRNRLRARVEVLEGRSLLSTLFVDASNTSGIENGTAASPFSKIQSAIADASTAGGDLISVAPGTYSEALVIDRLVTLEGPAGATGTTSTPAVIVPPVNNPAAGVDIAVKASHVTIEGLTIDGHSGALPAAGSVMLNGVNVNAGSGISNVDSFGVQTPVSGITVQNNTIRNFTEFGVIFDGGDPGAASSLSTGNTISNNTIDNMPTVASAPIGTNQARGISIEDNFYADVTGNVLTRVATGIQAIFMITPSGAATAASISNNQVQEYDRGILVYTQDTDTPTFSLTSNRVSAAAGADATNVGIDIDRVLHATTVTLGGNNVTGASIGIQLDYDSTTQGVPISGGTLKGNGYGVVLTNVNPPPSATAPKPCIASLSGVTITGSTQAGFSIIDALGQPGAGVPVTVSVDAATVVTGSPHGAVLSGPGASLADAAHPSVTFTATPRSGPSSSAIVSFTASDNITATGDLLLSYTLDGNPAVALSTTGTFTLSGLSNGPHTLVVRATDQAGNTGSATTSWTVGTPAPSTPVLTAASDSGVSHTDGITNVNTPTFIGTATPDSTVTLYANGNALGTTVASKKGTWSYTVATPLADGTYFITATASNKTGGSSAASGAEKIVIETTPPTATVSASLLPAGLFEMPLVPIRISGMVSPSLSRIVSASYTLRDSNGNVLATGSINISSDGTYSGLVTLIDLNGSLAKNLSSDTLTVNVLDAAGNTTSASTGIVNSSAHSLWPSFSLPFGIS
jgi:nitrous oxidase accessory protein NosD